VFLLLKLYARLCLRIYCRSVLVNKPAYLKLKGPVLFAANHPNSFLDGIILTTLLEETLYALARGDAFTPRWSKWLRRMHLLPVYRTSEGTGNLTHNYTTFSECHRVFEQGGAVLIFSEGCCRNEWHLRPLLKGTARLVTSAWQKGIALTVIPLGFNYSSFKSFGKTVHLNFGQPLQPDSILAAEGEGTRLALFNQQLEQQLQQLVYEIEPADKEKRGRHFGVPGPLSSKPLLLIPALLGWLVHAPLYFVAKWVAARFEKEHYDGVMVAVLMLSYPFYLLLIMLAAAPFAGWHAVWLLAVLPFCAWACVQLKPQ
jgi:1-acyl-sn-glycerol-3-phosphate acyltransferase